jgi:hypothetical protein
LGYREETVSTSDSWLSARLTRVPEPLFCFFENALNSLGKRMGSQYNLFDQQKKKKNDTAFRIVVSIAVAFPPFISARIIVRLFIWRG